MCDFFLIFCDLWQKYVILWIKSMLCVFGCADETWHFADDRCVMKQVMPMKVRELAFLWGCRVGRQVLLKNEGHR